MGAIRIFPQINDGNAKIYSPKVLMQTLFTPQEQLGFAGHPQGLIFMTFLAASQYVDINDDEFKTDIALSVSAGLLTQDRANQVLAGENPADNT